MVKRSQAGFGLMLALFLLGLVAVSLAAAVLLENTQSRREKEMQLLFVGDQYRRAIREYYLMSPGKPVLPTSVNDLLQDRRYPNVVRHLREAYVDPLSGKPLELIRDPFSQGIEGIASRAPGEPLKQDGFTPEDSSFKKSVSYSDWRFVFEPIDTSDAGLPTR